MKGSLGASVPSAITRPAGESRATIAPPIAPPISVLLRVLVGPCPLPGLLRVVEGSLGIMESGPFMVGSVCPGCGRHHDGDPPFTHCFALRIGGSPGGMLGASGR